MKTAVDILWNVGVDLVTLVAHFLAFLGIPALALVCLFVWDVSPYIVLPCMVIAYLIEKNVIEYFSDDEDDEDD